VLVRILIRLDGAVRATGVAATGRNGGGAGSVGAGVSRPGSMILLAVGVGMVTGMLGLTRYGLLGLIVL
jgi:hypothetical protein